MTTYPKHQRQHTRELKNMSKSIRLDIKKFLNKELKALPKKNLSLNTKAILTKDYLDYKAQISKS